MVWIYGEYLAQELNVGDSTFDPSIAQAVYGAGAKLDWHNHPGGQVALHISQSHRLRGKKQFWLEPVTGKGYSGVK